MMKRAIPNPIDEMEAIERVHPIQRHVDWLMRQIFAIPKDSLIKHVASSLVYDHRSSINILKVAAPTLDGTLDIEGRVPPKDWRPSRFETRTSRDQAPMLPTCKPPNSGIMNEIESQTMYGILHPNVSKAIAFISFVEG